MIYVRFEVAASHAWRQPERIQATDPGRAAHRCSGPDGDLAILRAQNLPQTDVRRGGLG